MARRGENIRKRKDGRWEGRYKSCLDSNGKWKYRSVYGKTYFEVKNKLVVVKNNPSTFDNIKERKFSDVLSLWLESIRIRIKGATENKYRYMIERHINPVLGNYKVSSLNSVIINSFLDMKLKNGKLNGTGGLAPSYVQTLAIIIGAAIKFAAQEDMCVPLKNPIYKPALPKKKLSIFSKETQRQLEETLLDNIDEARLGIFIALHTGMRIGEICALAWTDIDFEKAIIHVNHTIARVRLDSQSASQLILDTPKTKASMREIPISSVLLPILNKMHQSSKSKYVISNKSSFVSTRTFDYQYRKILQEAGIPKTNFHTLRHTFATRCVEVGVDVKSLSEILGHANIGITLNIYVHPTIDMKKKQLEKLYVTI